MTQRDKERLLDEFDDELDFPEPAEIEETEEEEDEEEADALLLDTS